MTWHPWILGLMSLLFAAAPAAADVELELVVVDAAAAPLPARVHLRDASGHAYPGYPDSALMSHGQHGGFFYTPGTVTAELPPGPTHITVGHGFEWTPVTLTPDLQCDTTIVVELEEIIDMRARGWICADPHTHSLHDSCAYPVGPERVHLLGRCEDLEQIWCLDQDYEFTAGLPHAVSTPELAICYTIEYRNLAYGHAGFLGLEEMMGTWCCGPPNFPAFPMLSDLREEWGPGPGQALELAHPQTGADFFEDNTWPAGGLGRELPVLAALGHLDALDLMAYSNNPDLFLDDWYALLNCGLQVAPSTGTDAIVSRYMTRPAGGYRTYAFEGVGVTHTPAEWVAAMKAGRSFVTNYPLIPAFTVNGSPAGETLALPGATAEVSVDLEIVSALPVDAVEITANGATLREIPIAGTALDTMVTVTLEESSWLALRVRGTTQSVHAVSGELYAHTAPVYVHLDGAAPRVVGAAGYFLDWIDDLQLFVELRGNWAHYSDYLHVLSRLSAARTYYGSLYQVPPDPFALRLPAAGDTLYLNGGPLHFEWEAASDPESGDRVHYRLDLSADSLFTSAFTFGPIEETVLDFEELPLTPDQEYWWRVRAEDRGGNERISTPEARRLFLSSIPWAGLPENHTCPIGLAQCRLSIWPNPARGPVAFHLSPVPREPLSVEVLDAEGRRIAATHFGADARTGDASLRARARGIYQWDGRDQRGRRVPTGCYWIRLTGADAALIRPVLMLR